MPSKIKYYKKKLMRNKICCTICAACVMLGFLAIVGFAGAYETGTATTGQFLMRELFAIIFMSIAVFSVQIFDARIEIIAEHIENLYEKQLHPTVIGR